jgi:two-component sensor histidine kinase
MSKILPPQAEQTLQILAIESLAAEFHKPVVEVRQTYEKQLARLKSMARIHDFLTVFALRDTRSRLRIAQR